MTAEVMVGLYRLAGLLVVAKEGGGAEVTVGGGQSVGLPIAVEDRVEGLILQKDL